MDRLKQKVKELEADSEDNDDTEQSMVKMKELVNMIPL